MRKVLLTLGALTTVVLPTTVLVSCTKKDVKAAEKNVINYLPANLQTEVKTFMSIYSNHSLSPVAKGYYVVDGIYFQSNKVGTRSIDNFNIQPNGDYSLTINEITDKLMDSGIEIQGSDKSLYVYGNINDHSDIENKQEWSDKRIITSLSRNTNDEWIYYTKDNTRLKLSTGSSYWKTYVLDQIGETIKDKSISATNVMNAINTLLAKDKFQIANDSDGNPEFKFSTTGRIIVELYVSKMPTSPKSA